MALTPQADAKPDAAPKAETPPPVQNPENSRVTIAVPSSDVGSFPPAAPMPGFNGSGKKDISGRTLWGLVTGGVGAIIGGVGTGIYIDRKLADFNQEVSVKTKADILGRNGAAAGGTESSFSRLGAGLGDHAIREGHTWEIGRSGKYPMAKFFYDNFEGPQRGKGYLVLAGAAVAGLAATALYFMLVPKEKPKAKGGEDWANQVSQENNGPSAQSR